MFTINIYLKLALTAVLLIGGIILAFIMGFWYSFPLLLGGLILLVSYILLGTVQSAAQLVEQSRFQEAEKRLAMTVSPRLLYKPNRAYLFLMKGTLELQKKSLDRAEEHFLRSQSIGLPSDNEEALVSVQLANIAASRNNWAASKLHLRSAKQRKVTDSNLKEQIRDFEKALANQGAMKHARMGGKKGMYHTPGGKRRRPKMR